MFMSCLLLMHTFFFCSSFVSVFFYYAMLSGCSYFSPLFLFYVRVLYVYVLLCEEERSAQPCAQINFTDRTAIFLVHVAKLTRKRQLYPLSLRETFFQDINRASINDMMYHSVYTPGALNEVKGYSPPDPTPDSWKT